MKPTQPNFSGFKLLLAVSLGCLISIQVQTPASSTQHRSEREKIAIQYRPPQGKGKPQATVSGGTRTQCRFDKQQSDPPLTLLIPADQLGLTTRTHPQFFVYLPETVATEAEFVLRDRNGNYKYRARYTLPQTPGVVMLELPDSEKPLEANTEYQWIFAIVCNPDDRTEDMLAIGSLQLTELSPTQKRQLDQAAPQQQAELYAKYGIWHEALTSLVELQCSPENQQTAIWEQLLRSEAVKLDAIATQPLIECATLKIEN